MSEIYELYAVFRGNVQGVGFRWTVVDHAERLRLTGTTKNLSDGTVEVIAQGEKERLEHFVQAIQEDSKPAKVSSVSCDYHKASDSYPDFRIIH